MDDLFKRMYPNNQLTGDGKNFTFPYNLYRGYRKHILTNGLDKDDLEHRKIWIEQIEKSKITDFSSFIENEIIQEFGNELSKLMDSYIHQHGLFIDPFFEKTVRSRITQITLRASFNIKEFKRFYSTVFPDLMYYSRIITSIQGRRQSDLNIRKEIGWIITDYIYDSMAVQTINDPIKYNVIENWFLENSNTKTCLICGRKFRVIDLFNFSYYGSNGIVNCCYRCPVMQIPDKAQVKKAIHDLIDICGFIPTSNFSPFNFYFSSRLNEAQWLDAVVKFGEMGSVYCVKKLFGSWFKALVELDVFPDGVQVLSRGIRCMANDGHECHSLDEKFIDDWLSAREIEHEREPYYPFDPQLNPHSRRRADWKVGNKYIEYFGLLGDENYENRMREKIKLADDKGIELIPIYPKDLSNLESIFIQSGIA